MFTLIPQAAPINPIDPDLAMFVSGILNLKEKGLLESTFAPLIAAREAAQVKPTVTQSKPARTVRKSADTVKRQDRKTTNTDHAYIRLVACELALMDAYEVAPIDGYSGIEDVPTIGAVDAAYKALRPYCEAVTVSFGANSAHYAEAAALVA
jgi:hypothetical protein